MLSWSIHHSDRAKHEGENRVWEWSTSVVDEVGTEQVVSHRLWELLARADVPGVPQVAAQSLIARPEANATSRLMPEPRQTRP